MTCKMHLKEGSVRIGVPQHICIFGLTLRSEDGGGEYTFLERSLYWELGRGRQKYTFLERSLYWESKNFKIRATSLREKLLWQKPKI